jgi:hypothetical protein
MIVRLSAHGMRRFVETSACSCGDPTCKYPAKHPQFNKFDLPHGCKSAATERRLIKTWWVRWPLANIDIATDQLLILDLDFYKGAGETLAKLEETYGPLPETVAAITGSGGRHKFYRRPLGTLPSRKDVLGPGIDTRADGDYVVAPPSLHKSGTRYTWLRDPETTPIADAPPWVLDLAGHRAESRVVAPARLTSQPKKKIESLSHINATRKAFLVASIPWSADKLHEVASQGWRGLDVDAIIARGLGLNPDALLAGEPYTGTQRRILPGPSCGKRGAMLIRGQGGDILYQEHPHDCFPAYDLPKVRAIQAYGSAEKVGKLGKVAHFLWRLRALYESGAFVLPHVPHAPLPKSASPNTRAVYDGFVLLVGLQWMYDPGGSVPFMWDFAAAWCGVSGYAVRKASPWLIKHRYICVVKKVQVGKRTMRLFLPGLVVDPEYDEPINMEDVFEADLTADPQELRF